MSRLVRNETDPETSPGNDLQFTVHDYQNPSSTCQRSQATVVNETHSLLKFAVRKKSGWNAGKQNVEVTRMKPPRCFMLAERPPMIPFPSKNVASLKAWGDPATEDEMYRLCDLESFIGTNMTFLSGNIHRDSCSRVIEEKQKSHSSEPTLKKRRLNSQSLHRAIPQPHVYPSPFLPSKPPLQGMPFDRCEPVLLPPYAQVSLPDDARVAWLIPVRGILPWSDCSSAELLDDSEDPVSSSEQNSQITWSRSSLLKFWDFLVDLRASGTLGALGISFHVSQSNQHAKRSSTNHRAATFSTSVLPSYPTSNSEKTRPTLKTLDYIKIHHDYRRRLHLRRTLDEWSYPASAGSNLSQQITLRNARFALLDAISQAILIL